MKKFFAVMLIAVLSMTMFTACDQAKVEGKNAILNVTVPLVATYGDCSNSDAIKADFDKKLNEWFKINEAQTEGEGKAALKAVCTVALSAVVPSLINFGGDKLPEAWDCSLSTINTTVLKLSQEACSKIK